MMQVLGWYINESAFCCKVCFMLASTSLQTEIQLCGMWLAPSLLSQQSLWSEGLTSLWLKHIMPGCPLLRKIYLAQQPNIRFQSLFQCIMHRLRGSAHKKIFESLGHFTSNFFTSNAGKCLNLRWDSGTTQQIPTSDSLTTQIDTSLMLQGPPHMGKAWSKTQVTNSLKGKMFFSWGNNTS